MQNRPMNKAEPPAAKAPQLRRGRRRPRPQPRGRAGRLLRASAAYPSGSGVEAVREELTVAAAPPAWSAVAADASEMRLDPRNRPALARMCKREAWHMAMARSPWLNCGATVTLSKASIAAFPTAIRHRRSDQVSPTSKAALTRTLEVTSGESAYKLVIQGCLRCRTKGRGRLPNTPIPG